MNLEKVYHVAVYAPPTQVDAILNGITAVTPLRYSNYEKVVWFSEPGTEQFQPATSANPAVGTPGKISRLPSVKIEFAIPRDLDLLKKVITVGIYPHHPWEEPVIIVRKSWAVRK